MERTMLAGMPPDKLDLLSRLSGGHKEFSQHAATLKEMTEAIKQGQHARSLELYRNLPANLRQDKMVLLLRMTAAAAVDQGDYLAATDEYRRLFPGDSSIDLISIEGHCLKGEWDAAHEALDRIDVAVGGDPYLQIAHGNVDLRKGDHAQAQSRVKAFLQDDPNNFDAHWLLVSISLAQKNHARTAQLLAKLRDELKVELGDLTQVAEYADFVRSPEYEAWKKSILK